MKIVVNNADYPISVPFVETYTMTSTVSTLRLPSRRLASGNKIMVTDSLGIFNTVYLYRKDNTYISISRNQMVTLDDDFDNLFFYSSSAIGSQDDITVRIYGENVVYDELLITCDAENNVNKELSEPVINGDMIVSYSISAGSYNTSLLVIEGGSDTLSVPDYTKLIARVNVNATYDRLRAYISGVTSAIITYVVWRPRT